MKGAERNRHLAPKDVLDGQKVRLRPPRVDEFPFIRALWGDPDTMASVGGPVDFPESKAREWFRRMVEPGGASDCYCLVLNEDDVPVGEISFHHWDAEQRSADLNVKILAVSRGHGYGRDALRTFLEFFFGRVGGHFMTDDVALKNRAGQQLLASMGFEKNDRVSDVFRMTLTRQMYLERYGEPGQGLNDRARL
ncbi:GNAT family N-acetyltransferase [Planctomycetota bacterium]